MTEMRAKALELVVDLTKQVITLSTALIALGITFLKDFATAAPHNAQLWLAGSWVAFLLSVAFGLLTLMACAGIVGRAEDADSASPYQGNARVLSGLQLAAFMIGLVMSLAAGFASL